KYKEVLTPAEKAHIEDVIHKCSVQIKEASEEEARRNLYRTMNGLEDSLRSSDNTLSYRYVVGHASETFPIYEKYKSIMNQFELEKKAIKENVSDFDLSTDKLERYVTLLQNCNFIVKYISQ